MSKFLRPLASMLEVDSSLALLGCSRRVTQPQCLHHSMVQPRLRQAGHIRHITSTATSTVSQTSATLRDDVRYLEVTWHDGHVSQFPYPWLRDSCRCDKCYLKSSKSRILSMHTWKFHTKPTHIQIMTDDKALLNWTECMERKGLYLIKHAPAEVGQIRRFASRIACLRRTNYNEEFSVKAKVKPNNHAYTSATLGLHTDLADYQYTPGIQMLHCIRQVPTQGGENIFADGFYVAELMKQLRPDLYQVLTDTTLEFRDIGEENYKFHMIGRHKTIKFNEGEYKRITFNNQSRDYFLNVPLEHVSSVYEALHMYNDLLYKHDNHIKIKLQPGEIVFFHNYRVLHGRQAFQVLQEGERHLEGGFLDWDDVHSRRRIIMYEHGI